MCRAVGSILAWDEEINQQRSSKSENSGVKKACIWAHARPQHAYGDARHQIADSVHGSEHAEARAAHFRGKQFRGHGLFQRLLHGAMHSLETKQNNKRCNCRRQKNETCVGHRSGEIAEGKQTAFSKTITERAGGVRRRRVDHVMERIKSYREGRGAAGAKLWSEYLAGAENQKRRREIADAMRENPGEKMPISLRHLSQAGGEARSVVSVSPFRGGNEKRKCDGGGETGDERPFQNAARADESDERCGAERSEDGAHSVHRALESKRAALLLGRYCICEQR